MTEAPLAISNIVEKKLTESPLVVYAGHHTPSSLLAIIEQAPHGDYITNHLIAPAAPTVDRLGVRQFMDALVDNELAGVASGLQLVDYPRSRSLPEGAGFTAGKIYFLQDVGKTTIERSTAINGIGQELGLAAEQQEPETYPLRHLTLVSVYPDPELAQHLLNGVRYLDQEPHETPARSIQVVRSVDFLHHYVPNSRNRQKITEPLTGLHY